MADLVGEAYVRITADTTAMRRAINRAAGDAANDYTSEFGRRVEAIADAKLAGARESLAQAMVDPKEFDRMARNFDSVEDAARRYRNELAALRRENKVNSKEFDVFSNAVNKWERSTLAASRAAEQKAKWDKITADRAREMLVIYRQSQVAIVRNDNHVLRFGRRVDLLGDRFVILGDRIGRVFGKGSRSELLNVFGRSIEALVTGPLRLAVEAVGKLSQGVGFLIQNFTEARSMGATFGQAMRGTLATAARAALPALGGLLAAMAAISVALPALVSGIFLLAGALVALAGSITLGIIGFLSAAAPLALAAAAGIGVMVLAFARARKEGTEAKKSMDRLKESFKGFGERLAKPVNDVMDAIADVTPTLLKAFEPLVKGIAGAVESIIRDFGKVLKDPAVKGFIKTITESLPKSTAAIGRGFNQMLVGILGLFAAVSPQTEKLASGFEKLMTRFAEFVKVPENQEKIKRWFDQAWTAADKLLKIIGNVIVILGELFTAGDAQTGETILDYLLRKTEELKKWLEDPKNKDALKNFFKDAEDAARTVKDIISDIGTALADLDTEQAREDFKKFLEVVHLVGQGLAVITTSIGIFRIALSLMANPVETVLGLIDDIVQKFAEFASVNAWLAPALSAMGALWKLVSDPIVALALAAAWAYDQLFGNSWIPDIVNGFAEWLPRLRTIVVESLAGIGEMMVAPFRAASQAIGELMGGLPGRVAGFLVRLPAVVIAAIQTVAILLPAPFRQGLSAVVTVVSSLPGRVAGFLGRIPGVVRSALSAVINALPQPFRDGAQRAIAAISGLPGRVRAVLGGIPGAVRSALSGVAAAASAAFASAYSAVAGWISAIRGLIGGILARISSVASQARALLPGFASGGVVYGPTTAIVGEAGREAIVPLDRPLSMIDPSVRALAAYAQGKTSFGSGGVAGMPQVNIYPGAIVVNSPNADPAAVAQQVIDQMAEAFR